VLVLFLLDGSKSFFEEADGIMIYDFVDPQDLSSIHLGALFLKILEVSLSDISLAPTNTDSELRRPSDADCNMQGEFG
jgi:hypothetical protein